ncbi:MAG TPA: 2-oxo acid dehydrogenase subunit E2 [Stellaceae bacterium]|nr:2-oxo acid dehydrogenase subunit E2 [Stellaceae bacterium]
MTGDSAQPVTRAPSDADRQPLSPMRRAIAQSTSASALIPQFTLQRSAVLDAVEAERARLRAADVRVSYQDFAVAAAAAALVRHPGVNASFDVDAIVTHAAVNVGIAIALADGLVGPAILDADRLSVVEIAAARIRLNEAVREQRIGGRELFGATFTVSNLGPLGVESFSALVVPPQAAILAVGAVSGAPLAPRVALSLSCDHRVVDGAVGARFMQAFKRLIEQPALMLL